MTTSPSETLPDEASTVDYQDLSGDEVSTFEEVEQSSDDIGWVAKTLERSGARQTFPFFFGIVFGNQHCTRRYRVDCDLRSETQGEDFGQHHHTGLADRMCGKSGPGLEPGQIRDVDHLTSRSAEGRDGTLSAEEDRTQIQINDRVPLLGRGVFELDPMHDRRRVDQDIEPPQLTHHLFWKRPRGMRVSKIGRKAGSLTPAFTICARSSVAPSAEA